MVVTSEKQNIIESFLCFFYIVEVFYCMAIGKVSIVLAIIEFFIAFLSSLFFGYKFFSSFIPFCCYFLFRFFFCYITKHFVVKC
jgi:hypothetical protein